MKLLCTLFATFFMSNFFSRAEHDAYVPATEIGLGRDTIRHFTRTYKEMNAYVISQVPMPMEKDIAIPPCLQCGNFARSIQVGRHRQLTGFMSNAVEMFLFSYYTPRLAATKNV